MQPLCSQQARRWSKQRGVALLFCLFALTLLTSIALGLIYMSDTETTINQNFRTSQQAYFGANAGLEEARSRLTPNILNGIPLPTALPSPAPGSLIYILNPGVVGGAVETVNPSDPASPYFDNELCHENYPALGLVNPGFNLPCSAASAAWTTVWSKDPGTKTTSALNFKWVRINLKINATDAHGGLTPAGGYFVNDPAIYGYTTQVCWDGTQEVLKPPDPAYTACDKPANPADPIYEPVVVVTAFGKGSRRITQMEVAQNPPISVEAPVASQDHVTLNGALAVNGYDFCTCQPSTDALGHTIYVSRPGKTCDPSKWAIYSHSTVDTLSGNSETAISSHTPPIAQNAPWNHNVDAMVESFRTAPLTKSVLDAPYNWTCSGTPQPDCGTHSGASFGVPPTFPPSPPDNPAGPPDMAMQFTYVPGDLHITGGTQGNGVLVVDGDLEIHGGLTFYGLILVKGIVKFTGGGSEATNIYGAVLAGHQSIDEIDPMTLGGSANIYYDWCSLAQTNPPRPPSVLSFRELPY